MKKSRYMHTCTYAYKRMYAYTNTNINTHTYMHTQKGPHDVEFVFGGTLIEPHGVSDLVKQ
jgi:hypothetical protein